MDSQDSQNQPTTTPQPEVFSQNQQGTPQTVTAAQQPAQKEDPGIIWGVISLVCFFLGLSLVGAILAYLGQKKSKEAGFSGTLSFVSLIINIIATVLGILIFGFFFFIFVLAAAGS